MKYCSVIVAYQLTVFDIIPSFYMYLTLLHIIYYYDLYSYAIYIFLLFASLSIPSPFLFKSFGVNFEYTNT